MIKNQITTMLLLLLLSTISAGAGFYLSTRRMGKVTGILQKELADSVYTVIRNNQKIYWENQYELTKKQFQQLYHSESQQLKQDYKVKHIHSYNQIETKTLHRVKTTMKDSLIMDTITVGVFSYQDDHVAVNGQQQGDTIALSYSHKLSLSIIGHRKRRRDMDRFWERVNIFKKTPKIITVIPSDTATTITNIKLINIR